MKPSSLQFFFIFKSYVANLSAASASTDLSLQLLNLRVRFKFEPGPPELCDRHVKEIEQVSSLYLVF